MKGKINCGFALVASLLPYILPLSSASQTYDMIRREKAI